MLTISETICNRAAIPALNHAISCCECVCCGGSIKNERALFLGKWDGLVPARHWAWHTAKLDQVELEQSLKRKKTSRQGVGGWALCQKILKRSHLTSPLGQAPPANNKFSSATHTVRCNWLQLHRECICCGGSIKKRARLFF